MTTPATPSLEPNYADADETAHWYVDSPGGRAKHELNMARAYLALVARLREVERAAKESSDKFDASCWQRTNLEQECEALRAQLAAAVDALDRIYRVINAAGIYSLMNGVQLGQVVWCVKMQDAMAEAKEVLDATLAAKKP